MVREKGDKGKGKAAEPPQKKRKTREEREREAAERAADAFDAMESRRAGGICIGDTVRTPPAVHVRHLRLLTRLGPSEPRLPLSLRSDSVAV